MTQLKAKQMIADKMSGDDYSFLLMKRGDEVTRHMNTTLKIVSMQTNEKKNKKMCESEEC